VQARRSNCATGFILSGIGLATSKRYRSLHGFFRDRTCLLPALGA
jgi:hypothetical protein